MSYKPRRRSYASRALAAACLGAVTFVAAACSSGSGSSTGGGASSSSGSGSSAGSGSSSELPAANADLSQYSKQVTRLPTQPAIGGGVSQLKGKTVW